MVDLLALISSDQLLLTMTNIYLNPSSLNEELNLTEPFPSVRIPWLKLPEY
jgi:hypothetical protein